ncbi:MAG TPA: hypothetical protein VNJ53_01010 [Gaiellaceae bacterium]|nr:hypothetical protein [Gaiellaceae bacterium]
MREESHLDDMRAAIRGDFERLAERRGAQELMRVDERDQGEILDDEPVAAPAPEPPLAEVEPEPAPAPEAPTAEPEDDPAAAGPEPAAPAPRRSWLARLLGR